MNDFELTGPNLYYGFLETFPLGFEARVGSASLTLQRQT